VASLLHILSLLSSSFVEEEHQTWYFLTVTVWLSLAFYLMTRRIQQVSHTSLQSLSKMPQSSAGFSFVLMSYYKMSCKL